MRRGVIACVAACVTMYFGSACSSSAKAKANAQATKQSPCALLTRLDEIAGSVAHAQVSDPAAYERTRDEAATSYVSTVRALKKLTPDDLQPELDRIEAAVDQGRLQDALYARPSLDSYAAAMCGRGADGSSAPTTGPTG